MKSSNDSSLAPLDLKILGTFELRRNGYLLSLPKKAQALLAIIAVSPNRARPKEALATMLWGHTGTTQARASLRQCLVSLRASLCDNATAISTDGPTIALQVPGIINVDAIKFLHLARSDTLHDLMQAAAMFQEQLLDGMEIGLDPFDRWLSVERQRFAKEHLDLLQRLASRLAAVGENEEAISACRRLLALDPLNEECHRQLMSLLARSGNRGSALLHYAHCVELFRDELGVTPDINTVRLAEEIRREPTAHPSAGPPPEAPPGSSNAVPAPSLSVPDRPSIAILPFAHLGQQAELGYFVKGLVDDIAGALGREAGLFVVASPWRTAADCEEMDLTTLGNRLGVQYVLKGSVRFEKDESLIIVQLLDASRGTHVWSGRFRDRMDHLFDVQERLATKVAATIAPALMTFEAELTRNRPTSSLSAYQLYLRALTLFRESNESNQQALDLLARAIATDPHYATAHALAARCYQFQLMFAWRLPGDPRLQDGVRHGKRAIQLGANNPEALWMAGLALAHLAGELRHGLTHVERSLALNPNASNAWIASSLLNTYLDNAEVALEHFERAQRLNPLDLSQHVHWNVLAWAHLAAGRMEEAAEAAERTLRVRPDYPAGLRLKTVTTALLGRIDEAKACARRLQSLYPSTSIAWMEAFLTPLITNKRALEAYLRGARLANVPETVTRPLETG